MVDKLGFDDAFLHTQGSAKESLMRIAPEGLDVYYDNVGGPQLDDALVTMKNYGQISMSASSTYEIIELC